MEDAETPVLDTPCSTPCKPESTRIENILIEPGLNNVTTGSIEVPSPDQHDGHIGRSSRGSGCEDGELCFCSSSSKKRKSTDKKQKHKRKSSVYLGPKSKCKRMKTSILKKENQNGGKTVYPRIRDEANLGDLIRQINFMRSSPKPLQLTPYETEALKNQKASTLATATPKSNVKSMSRERWSFEPSSCVNNENLRECSETKTLRSSSERALQHEGLLTQPVTNQELPPCDIQGKESGSLPLLNTNTDASVPSNTLETVPRKRKGKNLKLSTSKRRPSKECNEKIADMDNEAKGSGQCPENDCPVVIDQMCNTTLSGICEGHRQSSEGQSSFISPVTSTSYSKAKPQHKHTKARKNDQKAPRGRRRTKIKSKQSSEFPVSPHNEDTPQEMCGESSVDKSEPHYYTDRLSNFEILDLPTPMIESKDKQPAIQPFCSLEFDPRLDKDDCDSEVSSSEELPILSPLQHEGKNFDVCDIVWVKWKRFPYLPAMVKHVYKKKKRLTVIMFTPGNELFSMSYCGRDAVLPFCHPRREEFQKAAESLENLEDRRFCMKSIEMVQDFFAKKTLQRLPGNDLTYFNKDDYLPPSPSCEDSSMLQDESGVLKENNLSQMVSLSSSVIQEEKCTVSKGRRPKNQLSKRGVQRQERLRQKTRILTDFLTSEECENRLVDIYSGKVKSELQTVFFNGTSKERSKLKYQGFGPIDDEDQIESLFETYIKWLHKINTNRHLHEVSYVFDVWIPEAIVFAFQRLHKYSKKQSWDKFYRGVRRTKEELRLMHEELVSVGHREDSMQEEEEREETALPRLQLLNCRS